jgi:acyl carrier protein
MDFDIEAILLTFIRENSLPLRAGATLQLDDNLFETGTIDSAGLIHLVGYIEERFDLIVPDEDLVPEKFTTIASIAEYIRHRLVNAARK